MIVAFFSLVERLFGEGLALWANRLHVVCLGVAVVAWASIPARALWSRRRAAALGAGWAPQWICPACGHTNVHTDTSCAQCRANGTSGVWRRLQAIPGLAWLARGARLAGLALRTMGVVFFYVLTVLAAHRFRFFRFDQKPLQEMLGAVAMVVLLLALFYGRRVLSWRLGSPVARATDSLITLALTGVFLILWILWAAAPFTRGAPLAVLAVTPDGAMRVLEPRRRTGRVVENPESGRLIVPIQYARFTWPLAGIDQTFVVRVGSHTVMSWVGARFVKFGAARWTGDGAWRPRLTAARNTFETAAPGVYGVHPAAVGEGLVLTPASEEARQP